MFIKKIVRPLLVSLFLLSSILASAQHGLLKIGDERHHYLTFSGALGYANVLQNVPYTNSRGGAGGLLGFSYERHNGNFVYSLGAEFDYKLVNIARNDFNVVVGMIDTEGDYLNYTYHFTDFGDQYQIAYVNIPLMFGYSNDKIYFLVGGKFGINAFNKYRVTSHLRTTGRYLFAMEDFTDMPDHFFTDVDLDNSANFNLDYSLIGSAEYGYNLPQGNTDSKMRFRVGVFADYGFKNIRFNKKYHEGDADGNVIILPTAAGSNPLDVTLNSLMTASEVSYQHNFNPLLVGIKLTVLFELPMNESCKCLQTSLRNTYRSRYYKPHKHRRNKIF